MAKYNDVMEHIRVTDEMQHRVLSRIRYHLNRKARQKRVLWTSLTGMVAVAVIILFIVQPWDMRRHNPSDLDQPQGVAVTHGRVEYASLSELSDTIGFDMPNIEDQVQVGMPITYSSINHTVAQMEFMYENQSVIYRKSEGKEDNSGDYNGYTRKEEWTINNTTVNVKGENGRVFLVLWTDETYSHSVRCVNGLNNEDMLNLLNVLLLD